MDVEEFIQKLIAYFVEHKNAKFYEIPYDKYKQQLDELSKFVSSDEWIYNKAATFTFKSGNKFKGGIINVKGNIEKGIIKNITRWLLSKKDVREIEPLFNEIMLSEDAIRLVFAKFNFAEYFGTITQEEYFH